MKPGILLTCIIYLFASKSSFCQRAANDIGVSLGYNHYQVTDNALNNLRHQGNSISGGLVFQKLGNSIIHKIELGLLVNTLKSRYEKEKGSLIIDQSISYSQVRKFRSVNRISLFLGGLAGIDYHISYYENWDESHLYWLTSYSLGADGMAVFQKSDNSAVTLEINAPLVALASRMPTPVFESEINPDFSWVFSRMHNDLRLATLNRNMVLNVELIYSINQKRKCKQQFFWQIRYVNNTLEYSEKLKILSHTFGVKLLF